MSLRERISFEGVKPELRREQKLWLQRLNSEELPNFIQTTIEEESPVTNANNWLEAAGAEPREEMRYMGQEGVLWTLWNGQNFWTSLDGVYFSSTAKMN